MFTKTVIRETLAEMIGTFLLALMVNCAIATYSLCGHIDANAISFAAGIGLLMSVCAAAKSSGSHVNPAVTLAFATVKKFEWNKVPHYMVGQYLGGFLAAAVAYINYSNTINAHQASPSNVIPRIQANETEGLINSTVAATVTRPEPKPFGAIFATYPQDQVTVMNALIDQIICTAILMFIIVAAVDKKNLNLPTHAIPVVLGFSLAGICTAFGFNCGAALNPGRDLPGRFFSVMAGWGAQPLEPLDGFYWWIGGWLGPHLGAIVGAWTYRIFIEMHLQDDDEHQSEPDDSMLKLKTNDEMLKGTA